MRTYFKHLLFMLAFAIATVATARADLWSEAAEALFWSDSGIDNIGGERGDAEDLIAELDDEYWTWLDFLWPEEIDSVETALDDAKSAYDTGYSLGLSAYNANYSAYYWYNKAVGLEGTNPSLEATYLNNCIYYANLSVVYHDDSLEAFSGEEESVVAFVQEAKKLVPETTAWRNSMLFMWSDAGKNWSNAEDTYWDAKSNHDKAANDYAMKAGGITDPEEISEIENALYWSSKWLSDAAESLVKCEATLKFAGDAALAAGKAKNGKEANVQFDLVGFYAYSASSYAFGGELYSGYSVEHIYTVQGILAKH